MSSRIRKAFVLEVGSKKAGTRVRKVDQPSKLLLSLCVPLAARRTQDRAISDKLASKATIEAELARTNLSS
jgi:hypothetical protein